MGEFSSIIIALSGIIIGAGVLFVWYAHQKIKQAYSQLQDAQDKWKSSKRNIENERREAFVKLKDEIYRKRKEFDLELKRERLELDRLQSKLSVKYENIEKREVQLDELRRDLQQKERNLSRSEDIMRANEAKLKTLYNDLINKLEHVSNMSKEEAKQGLYDTLEAEVRLSSQKWIQKVEDEARQTAKDKAIDTIVSAMQRYTADQVTQNSTGWFTFLMKI